jgi:hypothetical protein
MVTLFQEKHGRVEEDLEQTLRIVVRLNVQDLNNQMATMESEMPEQAMKQEKSLGNSNLDHKLETNSQEILITKIFFYCR